MNAAALLFTLMAVEVAIDVGLLKSEIKKTYASVSEQPEKDFIFPTGRAWAEDLGYPEELSRVPESAVESFAGVANPWELGRLSLGEHVLDLGCALSSWPEKRNRCRSPTPASTLSSPTASST